MLEERVAAAPECPRIEIMKLCGWKARRGRFRLKTAFSPGRRSVSSVVAIGRA